MININTLTPGVVIHPGEILKDELKARGVTQKQLAGYLNILESQLSEIITGKRYLNIETCFLVSAALDMDPKIWWNLQSLYIFEIAINDKALKRKAQRIKHRVKVEKEREANDKNKK